MKKKVFIPAYVKDYSMLSPTSKGKIDRTYIKLMCSAIDSYNTHRQSNLKKLNKDLGE
jgi:hypothetical protein